MFSNAKFANIEKILQEYEFPAETDTNKDLTCIICYKLLKNAYNGPCGCRYCFNCINQSLIDGNSFCPGKFEDCKEQNLKFEENLLIDQAANTRISRLMVKCPEIDCHFQDELKKISEHIRVCDIKPRNCPYYNFGCTHSKVPYHKMHEHLTDDSYNHAILMLEWMQNLKNEVATVEEKLESYKPIKNELKAVKYELELNKSAMKKMQEKMNQIIIRQNNGTADNSDSDRSTNSSISLFPLGYNNRSGYVSARRFNSDNSRFRGRSAVCRGRNGGRGYSRGRRGRNCRGSSEDRNDTE